MNLMIVLKLTKIYMKELEEGAVHLNNHRQLLLEQCHHQ